MNPTDIALACASCGLRYLVPGGQLIAGAVDLVRFAMKEGWIPNGSGGYLDPTCAKATGVQAGIAAAIASAITSERARAAREKAWPKLGKLEVKADPHQLHLARYLAPRALAAPPKRVDWIAPMTNIGVMANDAIGDCTCAGGAHMVQAWSANNGSQVIIPDVEVIKVYSAVGGYVPGDESTDQGAYALDVLRYWRDIGFVDHAGTAHKILGNVAIDPRNDLHMEIGLNLFGGIYAGFEMPVSAQDQEVWALLSGGPIGNGTPGSWGGHMVPLLNAGPLGYVCISWGRLYTISRAFVKTYCTEAYAVVSPDWAQAPRLSPSGVSIADLVSDLYAVAG